MIFLKNPEPQAMLKSDLVTCSKHIIIVIIFCLIDTVLTLASVMNQDFNPKEDHTTKGHAINQKPPIVMNIKGNRKHLSPQNGNNSAISIIHANE